MLKTLLHPAGGLFPQLSGLAAWAASLSGALRTTLIADEPLALLSGDLSSWSADDRTSLVKSLLDAVENKRVTDSPYSSAEAYAISITPAWRRNCGPSSPTANSVSPHGVSRFLSPKKQAQGTATRASAGGARCGR
jgi:hypothetical protein